MQEASLYETVAATYQNTQGHIRIDRYTSPPFLRLHHQRLYKVVQI